MTPSVPSLHVGRCEVAGGVLRRRHRVGRDLDLRGRAARRRDHEAPALGAAGAPLDVEHLARGEADPHPLNLVSRRAVAEASGAGRVRGERGTEMRGVLRRVQRVGIGTLAGRKRSEGGFLIRGKNGLVDPEVPLLNALMQSGDRESGLRTEDKPSVGKRSKPEDPVHLCEREERPGAGNCAADDSGSSGRDGDRAASRRRVGESLRDVLLGVREHKTVARGRAEARLVAEVVRVRLADLLR
jgi:hypothetical protein